MKKKVMIPIRASVMGQLEFAQKLNQAFVLNGWQVSVLNLDLESNPLYLQAYMNQEHADLLVTINCTGFELDLLGDDLYYNSLCIPAMHFVTCKAWEVAAQLNQRMNFTMEVYVMTESEKKFLEKYVPTIPQVNCLPAELWEQENICENHVLQKDFERQPVHVPQITDEKQRIISQLKQEIDSLPEVFSKLAYWSMEQYQKNPLAQPWELLEQYLDEIKFQVDLEEFCGLLLPVTMACDYVNLHRNHFAESVTMRNAGQMFYSKPEGSVVCKRLAEYLKKEEIRRL